MNVIIRFIFTGIFSIFLFFFAQDGFATDLDSKILSLSFENPNPRTGLSSTQDPEGNTWVKGQIPSTLLSRAITLQVTSSHITDYDLYVYQEGQLIRTERSTYGYEQEIRTRYPLYYFTTETPVYFLNIKQGPINKLKVSVQEPMQFVQQEQDNLMRISLYYGLIIMAIIFNVVFFLIFLDKHFSVYTLLQTNLLCTFFLEDGMLHYFFPSATPYFFYFLVWSTSLTAALLVLFTYYLLDLRHQDMRFKKMVVPAVVLVMIGLLVYTSTGNMFTRIAVHIGCFCLAVLCVYQAIIMFNKHVYARFLLLALAFLILMGGLYVLNEYFGGDFLSLFDVDGLRAASIVEVVAISYGLIYKVRHLRKENARYRTELRHYLELLQAERKTTARSETPSVTDTISDQNGIHETDSILVEIGEQYQLTEREKAVLECIWHGDSNQEISDKLNISINTTKYHVGKLYTKLEVKSRSEARMLKREISPVNRVKIQTI